MSKHARTCLQRVFDASRRIRLGGGPAHPDSPVGDDPLVDVGAGRLPCKMREVINVPPLWMAVDGSPSEE